MLPFREGKCKRTTADGERLVLDGTRRVAERWRMDYNHDMVKYLKTHINCHSMGSTLFVIIWAGILLTPDAFVRANWPGFRGPTGLGYTTEENLPIVWGGPANENVLWSSPLGGQGHASPIVWDDAAVVCTVNWPADVEDRRKVIPEHHVACYRASDGKLLWDTLVPPGPWLRTDFRSGPGGGYAAATPVTDGKLIYCAFASSVLAAIDFQGHIAWRKEIIPYSFDVTLGSSPVCHGDTVILFCAMAKKEDSRVVAFDKANGEVKWERRFPQMDFGHSTPVIIQVHNKPQMLLAASGMKEAGDALQSLDPADGRLLWSCRSEGDVSSPAFGQGLVYFDSGRGGPGAAVDPTGSGDVSDTHVRWTIMQRGEALSSPIVVGGYLYRLRTPGFLQCWEMATGKEVYSERLQDISSTWASPIADPKGRLFFATAGKSYVVQGGPEFRVLAVNDLGDGSHPSPAAAKGRLFLVGMKNIYCIGAGSGRILK
jgi:outer membrane protein assembly factor BamB